MVDMFWELLGARCVACRRPGPMLCGSCHRSVVAECPLVGRLDGTPVRALGGYSGTLRNVVRAAKNFHARAVMRELTVEMKWMFAAFAPATVVPIPPSKPGFRRRGYGLATDIARFSGRPMWTGLRLVDSVTQRGRTVDDRLNRREFRIRGLPPRKVILVDDVLTSGTTLRSAIATLRARDVTVVGIVVLAVARPIGFTRSTPQITEKGLV